MLEYDELLIKTSKSQTLKKQTKLWSIWHNKEVYNFLTKFFESPLPQGNNPSFQVVSFNQIYLDL